MTEEMDQIFERFVGRPIAARFGQGQGGMAGRWMPQVEVMQMEDALLVCADLPGIKREDVQVQVLHDRLVLEGERHEESRGTTREGFRRSERCYGRFYRMIPLPHGVDPDQAKARMQDGVLEVRIPMPGAARQARRVDIQ
jgi:HSP20 family molecular chaperone IbpA